MKIAVTYRARERERYTSDMFDGQIGEQVPLTLMSHQNGRATLISVEVAEDGYEVRMTWEAPDVPIAGVVSRYRPERVLTRRRC